MGKFSNVYNKPSAPVPESNLLNAELQRKGIPSLEDTFSAVRANAEAEIEPNRYQQSSSQATPTEGEEGVSFAAPGSRAKEYEEVPFEDASVSTDPREAVSPETGLPLEPEVLEAQVMREREDQAARARGINIDWETRDEYAAAFPAVYKESTVGPIHRASKDIFDSLTQSKTELAHVDDVAKLPVEVSGMTYLRQGLNLLPTQASSVLTMASSLLSPMLSGNKEAKTSDEDSSMDYLDSILSMDGEGPLSVQEWGSGVPLESAVHIMGRLTKQLSKASGSVDQRGFPIDPSTQQPQNIDTNVAGGIAVQAAIDSNLFIVHQDQDGVQTLRLHPTIGTAFYAATRELQHNITGSLSGKTQSVPVSETGEYIGASRNIRGGDKDKPGATKVDKITEFKRIAGSIGLNANVDKAFFGALFSGNMLNQLQGGGVGLFDTLHLFKLSKGDLPINGGDPAALSTKVTVDENARMNAAEHIKAGYLRYGKHWIDPTTLRMYSDANDANLQRNKWQRAVYDGVSIPMKVTGGYHMRPVSKMKASAFWTAIGKKVRTFGSDIRLVGEERELGFLLTLGHAMDVGKTVGKDTSALLPQDILTLVTPEFIQKSAHIGSILKSIVPENKAIVIQTLESPASFPLDKLSPEQISAIQTLLGGSDRETWGYKLQGYLDANDYLNASKNGTAFSPKVTTAIDMNSAGRAFLANDIGNADVLERVGLIWEYYVDKELQSTQPFGNPRSYYMNIAMTETIDSALGSSRSELADTYKGLFAKYSSPSFFKSFSKAVLLQTDYGKAIQFHKDNVKNFLADNPEFRDELLDEYQGDMGKMISDLNSIHTATLMKATDVWQQEIPKTIVKVVQMAGSSLASKGFYNDTLGLGSFIQKETGHFVEITGVNGDKQRIELTKRMFDPLAAAVDKKLKDEEGNVLPAPGPGTAAINQIGPVLGQYRESIVLTETANHINGGKSPKDMLWFVPVFDNFILNSDSFAQFYYVANNIAAPKVLSWDIQKSIQTDFNLKLKEAVDQVQKDGEAMIGVNGKYHGVLTTLDTEYKYLMNPSEGSIMTPRKKEFLSFLSSHSSGYVPPSPDRDPSLTVTPEQYRKILNKYMEFKDMKRNLARWLDLSSKRKYEPKIQSLASKGMGAFMT